MIYTVTFNPAIDYVVHPAGGLRLGEVNRNESEAFQYGGKGINVSSVLQTLGMPSTALGFVAGYTGTWLEKGLDDAGVKADFIRLPTGMTRINVKIKGAQESEINGIGPAITEPAMAELYARLDVLQAGDVLVLAGSIPSSMAPDTYEKIMARLDGRGVRMVVDSTRDLLVNVLKYHPFLIKPNNHELGEIFDRVLKTDEEIAECAAALQKRGARNVLVSMAGDGALLLDENGKTYRMGAAKGRVVNSVGAGDSMVAGFVAGYLQKEDYAYALKLGTAAGAATAFALGLCEKSAVDAILATL